MKLQWATYKDAADQCSLSRIWGGIHPYIDDIPGRKIGTEIGFDAFEYGKSLFEEINMITKSYENIAQSTEGDVKTTFEDMDRAGSITSLMIWTGMIALLITAVLSVCSLGNLTNSRLTTVSGGF